MKKERKPCTEERGKRIDFNQSQGKGREYSSETARFHLCLRTRKNLPCLKRGGENLKREEKREEIDREIKKKKRVT